MPSFFACRATRRTTPPPSLRSPVQGGAVSAAGVELHVGGAEPVTLACSTVVNSAGLFAPEPACSDGRKAFRCRHESALLHAVGPLTIRTPGLPGCSSIPRRARSQFSTLGAGASGRRRLETGVDYSFGPYARAALLMKCLWPSPRAQGRGAAARVHGGPAQDQRPEGAGRRFPHPRPEGTRRAGPGEPVRNRVPGPDRVDGHRRVSSADCWRDSIHGAPVALVMRRW